MTNEPRSASVMTLEPTLCALIARDDFLAWLKVHPEVVIDLLGVMSEKVRFLTEKIKQLALSNVYERTVSALKDMGRLEGSVRVIDRKPTQQELASMVGASREMVNKVMKELIGAGHLVSEEGGLRLDNNLKTNWHDDFIHFTH